MPMYAIHTKVCDLNLQNAPFIQMHKGPGPGGSGGWVSLWISKFGLKDALDTLPVGFAKPSQPLQKKTRLEVPENPRQENHTSYSLSCSLEVVHCMYIVLPAIRDVSNILKNLICSTVKTTYIAGILPKENYNCLGGHPTAQWWQTSAVRISDLFRAQMHELKHVSHRSIRFLILEVPRKLQKNRCYIASTLHKGPQKEASRFFPVFPTSETFEESDNWWSDGLVIPKPP